MAEIGRLCLSTIQERLLPDSANLRSWLSSFDVDVRLVFRISGIISQLAVRFLRQPLGRDNHVPSGPRIDRSLITIVRPGNCSNIECRVHKRTPDSRMLRLGRLGLRSLFERRPGHSTLLDSVVPRQVRKLLSPILIVSGRNDRNVRRRIRERSERELITRTVGAL